MVEKTRNYNQFKFAPWNRNINEKTLRKIDKDVKKNGWKVHPILVNKNFEIIDGQHRLIYAQKHNLPVYYVAIDDLTYKDCVSMNNSRSSWQINDYIKLYVSQGNKNYIKLQSLLKEFNFANPSTIISLIVGTASSTGYTTSKIREGTFVLTDAEYIKIQEKLLYLEDISVYVNSLKGRQSAIYAILAFCYDEPAINNERLSRQIKNRLSSMTPPVDTETAAKGIESVYNYEIPNGEYVYIANLYARYVKSKQFKHIKKEEAEYKYTKEEK